MAKNKYYAVADRTMRVMCKFSSDTYCNIGTVLSDNGFNTNCWFNVSDKKVYMYPYKYSDEESNNL